MYSLMHAHIRANIQVQARFTVYKFLHVYARIFMFIILYVYANVYEHGQA